MIEPGVRAGVDDQDRVQASVGEELGVHPGRVEPAHWAGGQAVGAEARM